MLAPARAEAAVASATVHISASQSRFLIGCLGGLTPALLQLIALDLEAVAASISPMGALGTVIRHLALVMLGGLLAWLHEDETNKVKLVELGIVAPAVFLGVMNGYNLNRERQPATASLTPAAVGTLGSIFLPRVAHAQEIEVAQVPEQLKQFSPPQESASEQFVRGLTGRMPTRVWYVIVSSHASEAEARSAAQADEQWLSAQGFQPELYEPSGGHPLYAVVIGANLERPEAEDLKRRAIAAGWLNTQMFGWRPS
jgi:hypothetical protein